MAVCSGATGLEQFLLLVDHGRGSLSIGLKTSEAQPGHHFQHVVCDCTFFKEGNEWFLYASIDGRGGLRFRLSLLGSGTKIKTLREGVFSRSSMTLQNLCRANVARYRRSIPLRELAINAGMNAHYFDHNVFPALVASHSPGSPCLNLVLDCLSSITDSATTKRQLVDYNYTG